MRTYSELLFLHGHVADADLAAVLTEPPATPAPNAQPVATATSANFPRREPMNLFKSLLYLGGLESMSSRIGAEDEAYGHTYGNRIASGRAFGQPAATTRRRSPAPVRRSAQADLDDRIGCIAGGCG